MAMKRSETDNVERALKANFGPIPVILVKRIKILFSSVVENPNS
jgi:hypothetical protein